MNGCARLPRPALVMSWSVLWDDFSTFVGPLLELDVERGEEDAWDLFDLVKWEGKCKPPVNVVFRQILKEFLLLVGSFVIAKSERVVDVFQLLGVVECQKGPR